MCTTKLCIMHSKLCAVLCRVRLSKRRSKTTKSAMNSKLIVRHRELNEEEVYAQVNFV